MHVFISNGAQATDSRNNNYYDKVNSYYDLLPRGERLRLGFQM